MSELLKRLQTGQRHIAEYTRPNADFICPVCKQESPCYASFVTLQAGYGSVHDGERQRSEYAEIAWMLCMDNY